VTGGAQDANGRNSFVIIGRSILLSLRFGYYLAWAFFGFQMVALFCFGPLPGQTRPMPTYPLAVGVMAPSTSASRPRCHIQIASRRMLATTAIFFFLGFFVLMRS
jgi:hypothetical protein